MTQKFYIIAGPTASGKSKLAVRLAEYLHGEIINADSLQVYADLNILSARPNKTEMKEVKHHLYGYLDSFAISNVSDWLKQVQKIIKTIETPVFVGGTGLYINALIEGISAIPDVDPDVRQKVRQMHINEVKAMVQDCFATDSQRLRRALEVQLTTQKPLSYFQKQPRVKLISGKFQIFFLNPPRNVLYNRCDQRFINMIENGVVDEVKELLKKKATGGVLKAIGVKEIISYLNGSISFNEMIFKVQQETRHYAKRQVTWFRHQLKNAIELKQINEDVLLQEILKNIS